MPSIGFLKLLLLLPVITYLGLMAWVAFYSNKLVFPVPPVGYSDSPDIIKFPYNEDGNSVSMVFLENPRSDYLIFYHHGNGEDLHSALPRLQFIRNAGFSVLSWDYPGYGTSDGKAGEKLTLEIAQKIWDTIPESFGFSPKKIILYGRSLGSGPAVNLASRNHAAGIILEGAFTSIFRVGIGFNILPWDIFDNLGSIPSIKCPLLVIHGTDDEKVPFAHGVRLYEKATQPKHFTWLDKGTHNDILETYSEIYYSSLTRFTELISQP